MHFTDGDRFVLGILVGVILASVLSMLVHVVAYWLVIGALVFVAYVVGKRWFEKKFRIGL